METFLELLKEALKGITRAISAHVFRKAFLDEKTTQGRDKRKGGSRKIKYFFMTTTACTARLLRRRVSPLLSY